MAAFDQGTLFKYNSLTDRHLVNYFSNERMRHHLVKNGLITKTGEVVPDAVYRVKMARREHRRRVRDLIAQAIVHKALEMERSRQIDIRKKIEEIAKIELVRRVREDRSRMGDEDCISYFSPGNMDVPSKPGLDKKRSQSDIDEYKLPATPDERSRMRLRRILPNEEIESKHLSQLDSLTLGEYSRILQKQDRERINKLPYLGIGKTTKICKNSVKKKKPKKKRTKSGENSVSDDHIQVNPSYIPTQPFEGSFPNRELGESFVTEKYCPICAEETKSDVCHNCSLSKDISINDEKNSNNTNINYNNQGKKRKKLIKRKRKHKFLITKTGRSNQSKVQSMTKLSILFHAPTQNRDYDIMVEQQPSGGNTLILYRDTLTNNSIFNVVSHRHKGFPFSLTFYINNVKDSRISTCCEYKHKVGKRIGGPNGHFSLFSVEGANPCYRCLTEQDLANERKGGQKKDTRSSEAEVNQPESISVGNSSERSNHEEDPNISNYSQNYSSDSDSDSDSLNESEKMGNDDDKLKKRKVSENKDESDNSVEISVNDSDSKSEINRRELNLDNRNNNAVDVHRKDSNEKNIKESTSLENEFSAPLTNANTKVTIKPKEKDSLVDSTEHVVNHKEENGDSIVAQDSSIKVDKSSEKENENFVGEKENIQLQDQNNFLQSHLDKSRSLSSSSENSRFSDTTENRKPIQLENELIVSPNNGELSERKDKEKTTTKTDDNYNATEPPVSNGSSGQIILVGISSDNKSSISSKDRSARDSTENELKSADSNLSDIRKNEGNNNPNSEEVKPLNLRFSTPTNTADFQKDNSLDINSEGSSNKELKVIAEKSNLDNLIVKEDSNVSSSISKDSEINPTKPNIHEMLKKPSINSESEEESSSESSTSSDSDGELEKPVNVPENINETELKLDLPKDDNDTGQPLSSNRINENSTDEDLETEPNIKIKSNPLIKSPDEKPNVLRSSMSSESETDYDAKSSISIATENDDVQSSAPAETTANDDNSGKGLDIYAENDDINFKRAKEICQSFNGGRINSLKIKNSELPSYVFDSIAEQLGAHPELKSIELSGCEVEIGLLNLLAKYLHNWPNLETLILSDNEFTDYSLQNLIDMLKFLYDNDGNPNSFKQCLKLLDFARCSIKENDLTQLIEMIGRNTKIEKFVLDGSKKIRSIFPEICKALQMNTNIKLLSLKNCDISEEMLNEGVEEFGVTIKGKFVI